MDELTNISEALRESLRALTGSAQSSFDLWFGDFNLTSLTEDKAVFETPTKLRKKILSTKYIDLIRQALDDLIGFTVDIEIYSLDEKNAFTPAPEPEAPVAAVSEESRIESEERERRIEAILNAPTSEKKTLLDEYTFDNFIEGSSNKFAKAACLAVAKEPCVYNPLFIYGHSGLGKTHLLYAVMNYMKKNHPHLKIVYKTSFLTGCLYCRPNQNTT